MMHAGKDARRVVSLAKPTGAGLPGGATMPTDEKVGSGVLGTLAEKIPLSRPSLSPRHAEDDTSAQPTPSSKRADNFLTYAQSARDPFSRRPLNALDSLVFSWLSYFRLSSQLRCARMPEGIGLHELLRAEDFSSMFGTSWDPESSRELLFAVCASPRFRDTRLCHFAYKTERATSEQFAAMTFMLPDGSAYLAFRGTDSTLVGWREDFNMASQLPVPSQCEAQRYLERVAPQLTGPIYLGGHSKGGNLATYAAASAPEDIQRRIVRVFSHDGPGFDDSFLEGEGYARIRDRVEKNVPKSSIIGLIMDERHEFTVVESGGISVLQHNPFLWEVESCEFKQADGLSASSRYFGSTLAAWMRRFTPEERGEFIATLFQVLSVTGATRFADIRENWRTSLPAMKEAVSSLAPEQRAFVTDVFKALARVATIDRMSDVASGLVDSLRASDEQ
ncbi:Mbeg1-like protein [Collinsella ihumii]|uniref:DUF2974 domain-containing protein n=1 Tax=Collinsella ihumii TaxID=1720204 RepID=A0AAW7JLQ4_9ACTN|nr:Mbeg1-like protein [Collinsella ihumii]MDN0068413.1 DUF2974 domain-containing protein [Collinsella ihumii]